MQEGLQYGSLRCPACEAEWAEELPPLWADDMWPTCKCGGVPILHRSLIDHAQLWLGVMTKEIPPDGVYA